MRGNNKRTERLKEEKKTIKHMQQEELQHVKEAEERVKRRRADKVSPRMDGARRERSIAHVELDDNACLKFIKSHLIGLG